MKLTPWYSEPTLPTRNGWYETRMKWYGGVRSLRLWWNGKDFVDGPDYGPGRQWWFGRDDQWRGLAEPPEKERDVLHAAMRDGARRVGQGRMLPEGTK